MFPRQYFDNDEIYKYTAIFGELFSNIRLERTDGTTGDTQYQAVPIAFGGREKYIARNDQDPDTMKSVAMQLPRMSFEFTGMQYAPDRQLNPTQRNFYEKTTGNVTTTANRFVPVPWNLGFNLYITARNVRDASKIVQQIVPYFTPGYNVKASMIDDQCAYDLMIVLQSIDMEDNYQGAMPDRRTLIWTLSFVLKGWFFGLEHTDGLIRWVQTDLFVDNGGNTPAVSTVSYPVVTGKTITQILPTDVYTVKVDMTDFGYVTRPIP